ncbi:MAG: hypothetical protein C0468_05985 [Planctomyces sp.]|nr:hypothetical protein [Planctomyces sp.]
MRQRLQTVVITTVLTLLVWAWAEAESLLTSPATARLTFASPPDSDLLITVDQPGWEGTVRTVLSGPTAGIAPVQQRLLGVVQLQPGMVGVPAAPGRHPVNLRRALEALPEIARAGVTIDSTEPETVTVVVDRLETRTLDIQLQTPSLALRGVPVISPAQAAVTLPSATWARLGPRALVWAQLSGADIAQLTDDAPQTLSAALSLPGLPVLPRLGQVSARISPESAQVTLSLRSRSVTVRLESVPVWVSVPHTEAGRWRITVLDPFVRSVEASGPAEQVESLSQRVEGPRALLELTSDELERRVESKAVTFQSPVTGLTFRADQTVVRLRIEPADNPRPDPAQLRAPAGPLDGPAEALNQPAAG